MASGGGNKSIYVGNLSPLCTEAVLYEKLLPTGSIESIKICKDATGASLGYAYVNYTKPEEAKTALEKLDNEQIYGQSLRTMWAQKDFKSKLLRAANLVVKNLPKHIDDKLLMDMFSRYGNILSVKVVTFPNGMSKGYGFVQFENEESAQNAMSAIDGEIVEGRKIAVAKFIPAEERQKFHQIAYCNNVCVKNLAPSVTIEEFEKLCDCFGVVSCAKIVTNEENESKGYGFVRFESNESASRAVEQLNRLRFHGRGLFASIAKVKSRNGKA